MPLDCDLLCSRLKGVAHVLLEQDKKEAAPCAARDDMLESLKETGIFFPNAKHIKYKYRDYKGYSELLLSKVVNAVLQYMNVQQIPLLYTWAGVNNQILRDRWNSNRIEKMKAEAVITEKENELTKFIETFDSDNQNLKRRNDELACENNFLQQQLFKQNDAQDNPLLFEGSEEDFYPDEIREMVLDAVWEKFNNTKAGSRRYDVYKGIRERNHYRKLTKQRADEIKKLLNDYRTMGAPLRSTLKDLGFTITEDGSTIVSRIMAMNGTRPRCPRPDQTSGKERIKRRTSLRLCFADLLLEKHLLSLRHRQADLGSDERCPCLLFMR